MITTAEAKALARELAQRERLTHSQVLEAVAHAAGCRDWNTFVATRDDSAAAGHPDDVARQRVVPVLRVFDAALAREFYCGVLGFAWDWDQRHEPGLPLYAQVTRDGCVLHLSEHHGDATPGSAAMLMVDDLAGYHEHLLAQGHQGVRPGIEDNPWGPTMTVLDPFGNRLVFWQPA